MCWHIRVACFFLLFAALAAAHDHDEFVLNARNAAPGGIRLEMSELPPTTVPTTVRYRLQAVGLPRSVLFSVFAKDFAHSFHEVASGFQVDESGNIVSSEPGTTGQPRRLDEMSFEPGPYPRGAAWEVALVSADRALRAFAKVIPYPITARDGSCTISMELVSPRGDRFMASGNGFPPNDEVATESKYSRRVIQKQWRISPAGLLTPNVVSHKASGADRSARYTVKGHSCEVTVEYEWGEPALSRR